MEYREPDLAQKLDYTIDTARNYVVDVEWWRAYHDAELDRLVRLALDNNVDLAQSALTMRRALYQARLSELDLWPGLDSSLGASAGRDLYRHDEFSNNRSFSGELGLNYELDLWGRMHDVADAREWEFRATVLDIETTRLALINSVVDLYFNLAYLHGAVRSTMGDIDNYRQMSGLAETKFKLGKSDAMEPLQVRQSLLAAENRLVTLQTQLRDNEQVLRNLLNLPPDAPLNINFPDLLAVDPLDVDLDVPLAVLANRPDLMAGEYRLRGAFKSLEAENKSWYPTVSLRTAVSSADRNIEDTFDFPVLLGRVSVSLPFLQWNTVKTNIKISETEYESTRLDFEGAINTALNEVAYYYHAYVNGKTSLANTKAKHDIDLELLALYDQRYQAGKAEFKDLLDSINTANASRLDVLNESYQLIKNENMVYKAMAGRYRAAEAFPAN